MWQHHEYGSADWLAAMFVIVAFWVVIALAIAWSVRQLTQPRADTASDARRLLDERLARGEIDAEDYRARHALLSERRA